MGLERGRSGGEVARRRWNILAEAVRNRSSRSQPTISNLGLITVTGHYVAGWFIYTCGGASLLVHHVVQSLTPEHLMGFNNTGNVCVWPSEEVLAYLALTDKCIFTGKTVLELGGGMSCLAGLFVAKYTQVDKVHLTDGNKASVENVRKILEENYVPKGKVSVETLRWCDVSDSYSYDIVLAADCLFFDDTRQDLVTALWNSLKKNGIGLVTAPKRGSTLEKFVSLCRSVGFLVSVSERYSDQVWQRHLTLLHSPSYNPDSHYPVLITLYKSNQY